MPNVALITGITGQDGSYLAELLLAKGYFVHGIVRRSSTTEGMRLIQLHAEEVNQTQQLVLHCADLADTTTIRRIVNQVQPTEFYHLAGQSDVALSFEIPESTCELTAMATLRIMEILRDLPNPPRFLHASSREIFGTPADSPQDESTRMNPNSPYGCAKAFATQMVKIYRESRGLFFCNAICYNHESPRRGESFVTRKITLAAARIQAGLQESISLGDINAARDWGYAKDFVLAMWLMLQQDEPQDFVIATGESHTVKEFLQIAFERAGLDWRNYVKLDDHFLRPADPCQLLGNPQKANHELGWFPSITFQELVYQMVDHDLMRAQRHGNTSMSHVNKER
jgi:GDPmannose 4,6-dehydratase